MATLDSSILPEILAALVAYVQRRLPAHLRVEAEDVAQEALVVAWPSLQGTGVEIQDPVQYLRGVVKHKYLDLLRQQGRRPSVPIDQVADAPPRRLVEEAAAEYRMMQAELTRALRVALKSLPPLELEFLYLRFYEGLKNDAASRRLGIDPEDGSRLQYAALRRLRLLMKIDSRHQRPVPLRAVR
jgi:RNA polymerase sigma factor (sigma-70 family)